MSRLSPCGQCSSANLTNCFFPCCGASVCDTCFFTSTMCDRVTMKPVDPCPACGGAQPTQDEEGLRVAYKKLADEGHRGAGERLVTLLDTLVMSRPELKEEHRHYADKFGNFGARPLSGSKEDDATIRQMMMKMLLEGKTETEIQNAMIDFLKSKGVNRFKNARKSEVKRNEPAANPFFSKSGTCGSCGKKDADARCARCNSAFYCNKDCQTKAW